MVVRATMLVLGFCAVIGGVCAKPMGLMSDVRTAASHAPATRLADRVDPARLFLYMPDPIAEAHGAGLAVGARPTGLTAEARPGSTGPTLLGMAGADAWGAVPLHERAPAATALSAAPIEARFAAPAALEHRAAPPSTEAAFTVPEPGGMGLVLCGVLVALFIGRRRRIWSA